MTKFFFSKNSGCDLDLDPITLKRELIRGIVILILVCSYIEIG